MTMTTFHIQEVDHALLPRVLPLIADYQTFYAQVPDLERNREYFGALVGNPARGIQFASLDPTGDVVGFATLYVVPSSLSAADYCLLNDLYTDAGHRGRGVARALMAHCQAYAQGRGFAELEWVTGQANLTAQRLYDGLGATKSPWYIYTMKTQAAD